MPTARGSLGVAVINGKIYALGGASRGGSLPVNTNEMYDPAKDSWTTKAPMPTPRMGFGTAVWQNEIYVMGGGSNATEVYDPASDTWGTRAQQPLTIAADVYPMTAGIVEGKIWLIYVNTTQVRNPESFPNGTLLPNPFPIVIQIYDPANDTWTTKGPSPIPYPYKIGSFDYTSALFLDEKFYLILNLHDHEQGAHPNPKPMQIYDPKTDTWTEGAHLIQDAIWAGSGATTGVNAPKRIYVLGGGYYPSMTLNQVYDVANNSYIIGAPMNSDRTASAVACVNDLVYAVGGYFSGGYGSTAIEQYTPVGYTGPTSANSTP